MPYDTLRDFTPVALVSMTPELLVVHPSLPANNMKELVALAKSRPGQLNMASTGTGGLPHLALELLNTAAKIDVLHIPYKGAAPAVVDVLAGHAQGLFADFPVLLPHIQANKMRALGLAAPERAALLPNLPTMKEQGLATVEAINWYGILVAPSTPSPIIAKPNEVIVKTLQDETIREKLIARGAQPVGSKPEAGSICCLSEGRHRALGEAGEDDEYQGGVIQRKGRAGKIAAFIITAAILGSAEYGLATALRPEHGRCFCLKDWWLSGCCAI